MQRNLKTDPIGNKDCQKINRLCYNRLVMIAQKRLPVSVWLDDFDTGELRAFHCVQCGKVVFEYRSSVQIIAGGEHYDKRPKVVMCHGVMKNGERCKQKYFIS